MVNYKLQRRKFLSFASLLPLFIFNSGLRANDIYSIEKVLEPRYMGNVDAPIKFTSRQIRLLSKNINLLPWATDKGNWRFLDTLDKALLK